MIDHYLVAKAQARCTGADTHDLHSLLGSYFGFIELAEEDPTCRTRAAEVEQRLRAFCQTGRLRQSPFANN